MTLLRHEALQAALDEPDLAKRLVVTPLLDREKQVGSASIDLRLGSDFLLLRRTRQPGLDPSSEAVRSRVGEMEEHLSVRFGEGFWLHPQQFALGATLEYVRLPPCYGAYVLGRSSWGRWGLLVATAVMVHPGWGGNLTLELVNEGDSPIRLFPGLRVAQLAVHSLDGETERAYASTDPKYVTPIGPEAARLAWEDKELEKVEELGRRLDREP